MSECIELLLLQVDLYTTEQRVSSAPVTINAHKNELVCLAVSQQGGMVSIWQSQNFNPLKGGDCEHEGDLDQNMGHSTKVIGYFSNLYQSNPVHNIGCNSMNLTLF